MIKRKTFFALASAFLLSLNSCKSVQRYELEGHLSEENIQYHEYMYVNISNHFDCAKNLVTKILNKTSRELVDWEVKDVKGLTDSNTYKGYKKDGMGVSGFEIQDYKFTITSKELITFSGQAKIEFYMSPDNNNVNFRSGCQMPNFSGAPTMVITSKEGHVMFTAAYYDTIGDPVQLEDQTRKNIINPNKLKYKIVERLHRKSGGYEVDSKKITDKSEFVKSYRNEGADWKECTENYVAAMLEAFTVTGWVIDKNVAYFWSPLSSTWYSFSATKDGRKGSGYVYLQFEDSVNQEGEISGKTCFLIKNAREASQNWSEKRVFFYFEDAEGEELLSIKSDAGTIAVPNINPTYEVIGPG